MSFILVVFPLRSHGRPHYMVMILLGYPHDVAITYEAFQSMGVPPVIIRLNGTFQQKKHPAIGASPV